MGKDMRHRHPALTALQTVIADLAGGIDRLLQVSTLQLDRPPPPDKSGETSMPKTQPTRRPCQRIFFFPWLRTNRA